jgi:Fur family ferric uptake transcriptional regulator
MSCLETLKEKGFKLTPQRKLIADFFEGSTSHLSAEEVIAHVHEKMPGVNKTTIYRNLDILEGLGCVLKSESEDHVIYHHAEVGHHHHLVCEKCGKSMDCDEMLFWPVEKLLRDKYGFRVDFKHKVITGLCEKCSKES